MIEPFTLESDQISVTVDPGRGSDILSVVDRRTGIDVMFSSPWRARADSIREGRSTVAATGSMQSWLEQYRGGWQTLSPNAGAPRTAHGAPLGYHGEASTIEWKVVELTDTSAQLHTELFSLPLQIDRSIEVVAKSVTVRDRVTNLSIAPMAFDFAHHPAFGGEFLNGPCVIRTGARAFVNDFEAGLEDVAPNSIHAWPHVSRLDGSTFDLSVVPGPEESRSAFGWLTDFESYWASISNPDLDLTVRLDWDGTLLPHAWFWQELNGMEGWPWFRRARVLAIEPSSTQTSGPSRASAIELDGLAHMTTQITLTVDTGV